MERHWRVLVEFTGTAAEAGLFSRAVQRLSGPSRDMWTVETWMHDEMMRRQNSALVDALAEMRLGAAAMTTGTAVLQ